MTLAAAAGLLAFLPETQASRGFVDFAYGWGSFQPGADVIGSSQSLGLGNSLLGHLGVELGSNKSKIRPIIGVQYRVFGATDSSDTTHLLQTVTPLMGLAIGKIWIEFGATPFVWNRSSTSGLGFVTGYETVVTHLGARVEAGYHYDFSPEISLVLAGGTQMFLLTTDQSIDGQAIDGTIGLRFWIGGVGHSARKAGFFGEDEGLDGYEGWRYPFGRGQ